MPQNSFERDFSSTGVRKRVGVRKPTEAQRIVAENGINSQECINFSQKSINKLFLREFFYIYRSPNFVKLTVCCPNA